MMSKFKSQNSKVKILGLGYLLTILLLFFYSFTQVDLGLTLTQLSVWQVAQRFFQNIGYFNRPISATIYFVIILSMFIFYGIFLALSSKKKLEIGLIWKIIIVVSVILTFSYNAFSYDLFNYIFDAKIFTFYNQNPFFHKALDYPLDPMLSFMHWTHRTYPYGPTWLGLTIPLSYLGFQFFLPTFFLFKILSSCFFIGSAYYIAKISGELFPKNKEFNLVFFALNPLVIIEGLVSAHNDMAMIFFLLMSIHLLVINKYVRSILVFIISIGVKFANILLIPLYLWIIYLKLKKQIISWEKIFIASIVLMTISVVYASFRTNFQPWYLLFLLPFASLIASRYYILIPSVIMSFFAMISYIPFLYLGNWGSPVPTILLYLTALPIFLSIIGAGSYYVYIKTHNYSKKMIE